MTLDEVNLINSKGTAIVNKLYTAVDGARVQRYFIGVYGGRIKEIEDPSINKTLNQKIQNIQDLIDSGELGSGGGSGGAAGTSEAVIKTFECGETISTGYAVALDSGLIYKFDINNSAYYGKCIGISNQTGNTGDNIIVTLQGTNIAVSGLTQGYQYISSTAGVLTNTAPSTGIIQTVGVALNATTIEVQIQKPYIKI